MEFERNEEETTTKYGEVSLLLYHFEDQDKERRVARKTIEPLLIGRRWPNDTGNRKESIYYVKCDQQFRIGANGQFHSVS